MRQTSRRQRRRRQAQVFDCFNKNRTFDKMLTLYKKTVALPRNNVAVESFMKINIDSLNSPKGPLRKIATTWQSRL